MRADLDRKMLFNGLNSNFHVDIAVAMQLSVGIFTAETTEAAEKCVWATDENQMHADEGVGTGEP